MGIQFSKWRIACMIGLCAAVMGGCWGSVNLGGGSTSNGSVSGDSTSSGSGSGGSTTSGNASSGNASSGNASSGNASSGSTGGIGGQCASSSSSGGGQCASSSSSGSGGGGQLVKADKVDLLLVVDNSRSMADKQEALAATFADLVNHLVNPPCIENTTGKELPAPPTRVDPCPVDSHRMHEPVTDMHIGIISTSIGGHGADSCPDVDTASGVCGTTPHNTNNDKAHLLARTDPCTNQQVPTFENKGFLVWDVFGKYGPPAPLEPTDLTSTVSSIITGVGQIGCGFESQLESWYRFLADPQPYASISVVNGYATPQGIDSELLAQRAGFLRPDSMLVVLGLSDENDCSIKESGQNFYAGQLRNGSFAFHLPKARAVCATNPNDPCCASCGQQDPPGCGPDPTCTINGNVAYHDDVTDAVNLRCWDQKRRFGIDFLYPADRYIQALTQPMIADQSGNLVPNPIFSDLDPDDANTTIRGPDLVIMAQIAGVPWQDIAKDPNDVDQGFRTATELLQTCAWPAILGDPANYVPPTNPYMIESIQPRPCIAPHNPINGGDRSISANDDLQYACIYGLATTRDCAGGMFASCDCVNPSVDNPLCDPMQPTVQGYAKAYPAPRLLNVVKGLGDQGVLASICPAQMYNPQSLAYGYRPALRSLHSRLALQL